MKKWAFGSKIKHAIQKGFLVGLASILLASVLVPLAPQFASAAPSNADERVKAYLYYYAFSKCVDGVESIPNSLVAQNKWPGSEEQRLGYYIDTEDGRRECPNMVSDALKVWGYPNLAAALKDWNYKQDSNGNWVNDRPGSGYAPGVRRTAFGGKEPSLSGADFYRFYYQTMTNACQLSGKKDYNTANAAEKSAADRGEGYLRVKEVTGNPPKTVDVIYKYGRTSPVDMAESAKDIPNFMGCVDIAKRASDNAPAFLTWVKNNPNDAITTPGANTGNEDGSDEKSSCQVDGVGWILCPVINLFAKMTDQAYKIISEMLTVNAFTGGDKQLQVAWENMRNIANVAFVIAFLIIIYSQITGVGITNYGIKKMLPRIIMAAILVNISYWLCAIAVDISNVLGVSMNSIIQNAGGEGLGAKGNEVSDFATGAGGWEGVAGTVIAGGLAAGALYLALPALLTGLVAAAFAVVVVFLVLTLRQALIILLIVIAPLAFVALLLPNTEDWFRKWRSLFTTLLLMFPIIGLIFGSSALASNIVMQAAGGGEEAADKGMKVAVQIMAGLISILPLAITPVVMKTAGGVLNRFAGFVNNPNKGPFDSMRKRAEQTGSSIRNRRSIRSSTENGKPTIYGKTLGRGYVSSARRNKKTEDLKNLRSASDRLVAADAMTDEKGNPSRYARQVAGESTLLTSATGGKLGAASDANIASVIAGAQYTIDEATAKEIKAEAVAVRSQNKEALKEILSDPAASEEKQAAAMQRLIRIADPGDIVDADGKVDEGYAKQVDQALQSNSEVLRRATAESLASDGPGFLKASDIDRLATGDHTRKDVDGSVLQNTLSDIARANAKTNVYSQEKMAAENAGNLKFAYDNADNAGKARMRQTANELLSNENLQGSIKHNLGAIQSIANDSPQNGSTSPTSNKTPSSPSITSGTNSVSAAAQQASAQSQSLSQTSSTPAVSTSTPTGGSTNTPSSSNVTSVPIANNSSNNNGSGTAGEMRIDHTSAENIAQAMNNSRNPTTPAGNITSSQTTNNATTNTTNNTSTTTSNTNNTTNTTNTTPSKPTPSTPGGQQNQPRVPENRDNSRMRRRESGLYAPDDNN